MPEGEQLHTSRVERPVGTNLLPDAFIEQASTAEGVEKFVSWLDGNLGETLLTHVTDQERAKQLVSGLFFYIQQREYAWLDQDDPSTEPPERYPPHVREAMRKLNEEYRKEFTPEMRRGRLSGMRDMLIHLFRVEPELKILDYLFEQSEAAPGYVRGPTAGNITGPR